jgi:hypothetical protein
VGRNENSKSAASATARAAGAEGCGDSAGWNSEEKEWKPSKDGGWSACRRRRKEWLVMTRWNAG